MSKTGGCARISAVEANVATLTGQVSTLMTQVSALQQGQITLQHNIDTHSLTPVSAQQKKQHVIAINVTVCILQGAKGQAGVDGKNGAKGETGAGEKGQAGEDGKNGAKGETGAGEKGQTGEDGKNGAKGETGAGEKGQTGEDGATGQTGAKGEAGAAAAGACMAENAEENPLGASFVASNSNQADTYQQWNNWLGTTWACDGCNAGSYSTMKLDSAMQLKGWKSSNGASTASQTWRLEGSMTNR